MARRGMLSLRVASCRHQLRLALGSVIDLHPRGCDDVVIEQSPVSNPSRALNLQQAPTAASVVKHSPVNHARDVPPPLPSNAADDADVEPHPADDGDNSDEECLQYYPSLKRGESLSLLEVRAQRDSLFGADYLGKANSPIMNGEVYMVSGTCDVFHV